MGQFSYKAVDTSGGHITGTIEATDRRGAVVALTNQGHFVTELIEQARPRAGLGGRAITLDLGRLLQFRSKRVTSKDILAITTQFSTALRAGLPLLTAIELIRKQQHKAGTRELLGDLAEAVSTGHSLSDAMARHERVFSPLYISMIKVGETGGILEQTSSQLAEMLTREEKIKTNMKNASAYPLFVLFLGLASVILVMTVILPRIISTLAADLSLLPLPTRILMGMSGFIKDLFTTFFGWVVLAAVIAGVVYLRIWIRTEGRLKYDAFKLMIPIM